MPRTMCFLHKSLCSWLPNCYWCLTPVGKLNWRASGPQHGLRECTSQRQGIMQ